MVRLISCPNTADFQGHLGRTYFCYHGNGSHLGNFGKLTVLFLFYFIFFLKTKRLTIFKLSQNVLFKDSLSPYREFFPNCFNYILKNDILSQKMYFFNKNWKFSSKIKIEMTNCKNSSVRVYIYPFLLYMPIFSFIGPSTAEKFTKEIQF